MMRKLQSFVSTNRRYVIYAVLSLGILAITLSPLSNMFVEVFDQDQLIQDNLSYLKHKETEARNAILVLAGLKSFFYTLQSSQVGINFIVDAQVTLGHALVPLTDMLDRAIEFFTLAALSTYLFSILSELAEVLAPVFFILILTGICLYSITACYAAKSQSLVKLKRLLKELTKISFIGFLLAYLFIPYSLHGEVYLNQKYTQIIKNELHQDMQNLHDSEVQNTSHEKLSENAKSSIKHYEKAVKHVPHKLEISTRYYTQHVVLWLIETLISPLILFGLFFLLVKKLKLRA